jgi:hypothetical protein
MTVLREYRPDLVCLRVGTEPTGLLVVVGLDPTSTALADNYDRIVAEHVRPDPQRVPAEILSRDTALPPRRVLDSPLWTLLREADAAGDATRLRTELRDVVRASLGQRAVGPTPAG